MNEETYLNVLLTLSKNASEILYHGSIEAADKSVLKCFNNALLDMIKTKDEIFKFMEKEGYYTLKPAKETKINEIKSKFNEIEMD